MIITMILTQLSSELLNQYEQMYFIYLCRFRFGNLSNPSNTTWTVNVGTTFTNILSEHDSCAFSNMTRTNPNPKLYQKFVINNGLSYACSARPYNSYNLSNCSINNGTDCDCFNATAGVVTLEGLQVSF